MAQGFGVGDIQVISCEDFQTLFALGFQSLSLGIKNESQSGDFDKSDSQFNLVRVIDGFQKVREKGVVGASGGEGAEGFGLDSGRYVKE